MNISFNPSKQPKGLLPRLLTLIVSIVLLGLAFMFSLVFVAVLAVVGVVFGLYFWWKTRTIRAQLRQQMESPPFTREASAQTGNSASEGEVIEGEAVRVNDERDGLLR